MRSKTKQKLWCTPKSRYRNKTCPKGFGLKLAKLGLKIPLKNKVKQKQSQTEPSWAKLERMKEEKKD